MSLSVGDIIQFDLRGNYNNLVETHNVFHYEVGAITPAGAARTTFLWLADAAASWMANALTALAPITGSLMSYNQIKAQVVFGADQGIQNTVLLDPLTNVGAVAGETLPPNVVWTFRKQGAGGTQRNGYQHFSGIPETEQADGFAVSAILDELASMAANLAAVKTVFLDGDDGEESHGNIIPCIVKRVANGENPDDVDILAKWYPVGVAYAKIGTVNSRKFGVGV